MRRLARHASTALALVTVVATAVAELRIEARLIGTRTLALLILCPLGALGAAGLLAWLGHGGGR